MKFKRLKSAMIDDLLSVRINNLLSQLSEKAVEKSPEDLKKILRNRKMFLLGLFGKDGVLAGMAAIHFKETLMRKSGVVEDVVVDSRCRGQGFGRKLIELLIKEAKKNGADCVELTSSPKRVEANAMYENLGFKKRETNCYRLDLSV